MILSLRLLIFIGFFVLSGCSIAPTQEELKNADYGAYPDDYEEIIKNYMVTVLIDPESARYRYLNKPRTGWRRVEGLKFGYLICAYVNAKNHYGGYAGEHLFYFMIKNGNVINHESDFWAQALCEKVV
jgi:hypothetical protein